MLVESKNFKVSASTGCAAGENRRLRYCCVTDKTVFQGYELCK